MSSNPVVAGIGLATCSITIVFATVLLVRLVCVSRNEVIRVILLSMVLLFELLRLVWWALELVYEPQVPQNAVAVNAAYIMNRLSWTVQMLTVLLLSYFWANAVHKQAGHDSRLFTIIFRVCFAGTASLVVVVFVVVITIAFTLCATASAGVYASTCGPIYNAQIIFTAAGLAVFSVGLMVYGIWLVVLLRKSQSGVSFPMKGVIVLIVCATVMAVVNFVRTGMLLYRPLTGLFSPLGVYYAFALIVPDLLTAVGVCVIILFSVLSVSKPLPEQTELHEPLLSSRPAAYEV
jgi:hypothetical protein